LYWTLFAKGLENGIQKHQEKMLLNEQRSVKRMARELGLEII